MKIVLVHNRYRSAAPSGENRVVDQEGQALRDRGHEVIAFERHSDDIEQWPAARCGLEQSLLRSDHGIGYQWRLPVITTHLSETDGSARPSNGDHRFCPQCGGVMRFKERYVITQARTTFALPAWVCACGNEEFLRGKSNGFTREPNPHPHRPLVTHRPPDDIASSATHLPHLEMLRRTQS